MAIKLEEESFDPAAEIARFEASLPIGSFGATASFVGTMRNHNEGDSVTAMTLEHYPGMTEKQIHAIIDRASSRWSVLGAVVIHRVGDLQPGEKIVFVGIASKHRGDAFRACEYVMDSLKTEATFWKKEVTEGEARWLTTRQTDVEALNKWQVD